MNPKDPDPNPDPQRSRRYVWDPGYEIRDQEKLISDPGPGVKKARDSGIATPVSHL
jgi:hypothetical protein